MQKNKKMKKRERLQSNKQKYINQQEMNYAPQ